MITKGGKNLMSRFKGSRVVTAVYKGLKLVWQAARACFSNGWDNNKGWENDEGWTND